MAGFEFIKPLRTTYFSFRSVHDCPFTTVFTTIRDHFPGFALHSLTHFLSEGATRRYFFSQFFAVASTKAGKRQKKRADRLFFTSDRLWSIRFNVSPGSAAQKLSGAR